MGNPCAIPCKIQNKKNPSFSNADFAGSDTFTGCLRKESQRNCSTVNSPMDQDLWAVHTSGSAMFAREIWRTQALDQSTGRHLLQTGVNGEVKFTKEWKGQKRTGTRKQRRREKGGRKRNSQHLYRQLTSATVVEETAMHQLVLPVMYDHVKHKSLSPSLSLYPPLSLSHPLSPSPSLFLSISPSLSFMHS